jgi:hypothetical protein
MITDAIIPYHLQEKVDRTLERGERIKWIDMPIPRFFTPYSKGMFVVAILWLGICSVWIAGAVGCEALNFNFGHGDRFLPLCAIPFVLLGIGVLSTPLWTHWKARRTLYLITDRRAIVFDGGWKGTIRSFPPEKLQEFYREDHRDGSVDVVIDPQWSQDADGHSHKWEFGFLQIRDADEVERLLDELANQDNSSGDVDRSQNLSAKTNCQS